MTNSQTALTSKPQHLNLTKILFYFLLAGITLHAAYLIINTVHFIGLPASQIEFKNTGSSYFVQSLFGYINISFETLPLPQEITDAKLFAVSVCIMIFIAYSLPLIIIMKLGHKLLKLLSLSYTPFTPETASLVRKIGKLMVIMGVFSKLFFQVSMNIINLHQINFVNPWELQWVLAGIITLLVADIFTKGCQLQQEVDETL